MQKDAEARKLVCILNGLSLALRQVVSAALAQNLGASRFISRSLLESRTEMLELLARRGTACLRAPEM